LPVQGDASTLEAEDLQTSVLQAATTTDGNGTPADVTGLAGAMVVELNNAGTGTTNANIEGSFDGTTWYACGYQQVDGIAAPARATAAISVAATPFAHVYALLDQYNRIRCRMSSSSVGPGPQLTATLRALPV
jgi:hypothetical protein